MRAFNPRRNGGHRALRVDLREGTFRKVEISAIHYPTKLPPLVVSPVCQQKIPSRSELRSPTTDFSPLSPDS